MSHSDGESDYNDLHRAFLQAFSARAVLTTEEIKPILSIILTAAHPDRPTLEGDITPPVVTNLIQTLNARLVSLDYEIRSTKDPISGTTVYALVNSTSDAVTQLATTFSADEIAFVKRVLDAMFEHPKKRDLYAVSSVDAAALARAPRTNRQSQVSGDGDTVMSNGDGVGTPAPTVKSIDMPTSDRILRTLVSQGFFAANRIAGTEYYRLGNRGLIELRMWLKEMYNEEDEDGEEGVKRVRDCEGCKEICTWGVRCRRGECGVRFHDQCRDVYFGKRRDEDKRCPGCRRGWVEAFVGPRVMSVGGGGGGGGSGRRRDEEENEDEEEDE
ncbi:hypothetical protein M011DRAFT_423751 [Sporormia fimetaria CBS 119925]|uniref:Non-structural maintenance of chromosomes element 1 homolog n=1 Tax=Sporormia fimetaria CBS 119925 TaxID=1340428 RepID=A0A6A6VCM9_9PLEO|nr:hypothetical protein M011DRAFT_423751 [Sporormia fimetaria CBS 119925]